MHFANLIDIRAHRYADRPALADEHNGRLTNAEAFARIETAVDRLAGIGVGAGDVVAIKLTNRVELIISLFAAWKLGAAVTPINPSLTVAEVCYQLADSAAQVLIADEAGAYPATVVNVDELSEPHAVAAVRDAAQHSDHDLALLIYTSGTTGRPKGVELTHPNLMAMAESINTAMGSGPDAHSLLILPLFHVNGIVVSVLSPLLAGGQATVAGRFDPRMFFKLVETHRPTYFSAV